MKHLEGYLNIDIDSNYVDLKENILNLELEKASIAEVIIIFAIRHIGFFKVEPFLKIIYSWFKGNGRLLIEFTDIIKLPRSIPRM